MSETCQEMKPQNPQEPLRQHSDGDEPWQKIGLNLFQIAGKHYLAVVGYYSNVIEIDLLTMMTRMILCRVEVHSLPGRSLIHLWRVTSSPEQAESQWQSRI